MTTPITAELNTTIMTTEQQAEKYAADHCAACNDRRLMNTTCDCGALEAAFLAGASSVEVGGMKVLRLDKPFPLKDILFRLTKATEYLLNQKDYDGPDYEELGHCVRGAKEVIEVLSESTSSSEAVRDDAAADLVIAMQGLIDDVLSKPNDTRYATAIGKAKQAIELFKQRK
jgi:hypothetical protein